MKKSLVFLLVLLLAVLSMMMVSAQNETFTPQELAKYELALEKIEEAEAEGATELNLTGLKPPSYHPRLVTSLT